MARFDRSARTRFGLMVLVGLTAAVMARPVSATLPGSTTDNLPIQLREQFEALTREHAKELNNEKNSDGREFQRALYSRKFDQVDESTYQVTYTLNVAIDDVMATRRYVQPISKASGDWKLGEAEMTDEYVGLLRRMPGDETFHRFDKIEFRREGLTIRGGAGVAYLDYVRGEPATIAFSAAGLEYSLEPPGLESHARERLMTLQAEEEHWKEMQFEPSFASINCDAETCGSVIATVFTNWRDGASKSDLESELEKRLDSFLKQVRDARKDNPLSGYYAPREDWVREWSATLKKRNKDRFFSVTYDNDDPWRVNVYASGYGRLLAYRSEQEIEDDVSLYEIEQRDEGLGRFYEVVSLNGEIELGLETSESLKADILYGLRLKRPAESVFFRLNVLGGERRASISVDSLRNMDTGEDLGWIPAGSSAGWVVFSDELPAETVVPLRMEFRNSGSIVKLTPSYQYMDRSGWLPFVEFTDKIGDFELVVKAPAKYKTLGIGTLLSQEVEGDVRITHWRAESPVTFPTLIYGDYIEDTPGTLATKMDGTEIPVTIHVDKDGMNDWEIRPKQLKPLAQQAVNALNLYREVYGVDYPYGKLDLVNDPLGFLYGQAPASIVYLGSGAFRGEGILASTSGGDASGTAKFLGSLVAHEVAHQWWGSLVGNKNQRNYWFVESLAEYSAALFVENVAEFEKRGSGRKAYLDHVEGWRQNILRSDLKSSVQDADTYWNNGGRTAAIYNKGPYAFHVLRETFGDEKFFPALKQMCQELAAKGEIVTLDIQRAIERAFGGTDDKGGQFNVDLDWFFDQWIRGVGTPQFAFFHESKKTEDGNYLVKVRIKQRVVAGLGKDELDDVYYRGVVPITITGRDKREYQVKLVVEGPETTHAFKLPVEPRAIALNKYGEILAHDVLENRTW